MTTSLSKSIRLNGEEKSIDSALTVAAFLDQQAISGRIVVVINDEVIPRSSWAHRLIQMGDDVEIMSPISGG